MPYQPIENYGIIGNMHTAALVGIDGSIDWMCHPRFDSPSIFAAILDDKKGGRFRIHASGAEKVKRKQFYWPGTNVLVTRSFSEEGAGQIVDYMPAGLPSDDPRRHWLIRRVQTLRGYMHFRMECSPAFNYARDGHELRLSAAGARFRSKDASVEVTGTVPMKKHDGGAMADFTLKEGETAVFVLRRCEADGDCSEFVPENEALVLFKDTVDFWRRWLSQSTYRGRWREMVERSALVLKLLTYEPTGAIVAAPTCSLPGGARRRPQLGLPLHLDPRRGLHALRAAAHRLHRRKPRPSWTGSSSVATSSSPDGSLQIMYGIDGRHDLAEETLDHLEGYRGLAAPCASATAPTISCSSTSTASCWTPSTSSTSTAPRSPTTSGATCGASSTGSATTGIAQDEGIWEVRGGQQHFVYSKLMCWVAIDRGLRLADKRSFPADRARWYRVRDEIYEDIMKRGWSAARQAFVQPTAARRSTPRTS